MTIVRAAEAPQFTPQEGFTITALTAPSRGANETCTWRLRVDPGARSGPHTFVVITGALRVTPDGDLVEAGGAVTVPAGAPIAVGNPAAEPAEAVVAIRAGFSATMADGTAVGTPPWAV